MRQIGRELEGEQGVVKLERAHGCPGPGRIGWQLKQAAVVFRELELACGAQHALAFDAAQFAGLDHKGFAIGARRQHCAHHGARHLDADAGIGCATNDVEQAALPCIDLANAQTIGIGVLHGIL
jgi:hypothetical protein